MIENGIKKNACNKLKNEIEVFAKAKCTIVFRFIGKANKGRMFITGIFCMKKRITKSKTK